MQIQLLSQWKNFGFLKSSVNEGFARFVPCKNIGSTRNLPWIIVCACPYSSNIGLSAMTLYYPVQDKTTTRPVNPQNYYTKI